MLQVSNMQMHDRAFSRFLVGILYSLAFRPVRDDQERFRKVMLQAALRQSFAGAGNYLPKYNVRVAQVVLYSNA
jgi:hypothetical protein